MKFSKTQAGLGVALLLSNVIILYGPDWSWLRLPAAVGMTLVLPGWAWLPALGWLLTRRGLERIALVVGLSSLIASLALLIALLLPGRFTLTPALAALDVTILLGLVAQAWPRFRPALPEAQNRIIWPVPRVLAILLFILLLTSVTRLTRLGYAEFHEDELENTRLIVRVYKGEEYAIFQDSKGPIHALTPAAIWYFNGWLNEGIARFPFALISLVQVPLVFELGRRLFQGRDSIGLLAAAFVSLNGYFVSLSRHLENRIFIVFWGVLLMWLVYRYYQEDIKHFLMYMALTLAIGLIAHFEMLFFVAVVGFFVLLKLWHTRPVNRLDWLWLGAAVVLFGGVAAIFYVPYFNDPEIGLVYQYLAEDRIGTSVLYNNVANMFTEDQDYNNRLHLPLLTLLLLWVLVRNFGHAGRRWLLLLAGLAGAMISAGLWPDLWLVAGLNLAFVPFALLTVAVLVLPKAAFEIRFLYLWLSAPIGAILFLTLDATNHVQLGQSAWAILGGVALVDLWRFIDPAATAPVPHMPAQTWSLPGPPGLKLGLKALLVTMLALAAAIVFSYLYLLSNATVTTFWQARLDSQMNPNSIYNWLYGHIPRPRRVISNPRFGGWKAVGYLWENGQLSGDFRSINESFAVPIWYTFQTPRSCYNDPHNLWVRRNEEGWPAEEAQLPAQGYALTRVVLVDGQPKLHLYEKGAAAGEPEILDVEDYRERFDRLATPDRFAQGEEAQQPASLNFGDKLLLRGYDLPGSAQAGSLLPVTLYWQALAPMDIRYRAFVHLIGPNDSRWGQHDDDPACRLMTSDMRPGQTSSRQFRAPVDPATPPGEYTVMMGVYQPDTFARLPIWDNWSQSSPGDTVILGTIEIK